MSLLDRGATAHEAEKPPRRALATVVAVVFIDLLGFGIVIPVLPFYVRSFGVSDVFIGLLAASYSLMQFGFAPLLGRLSDSRGRRPVLMISLAANAAAWVVFGLAAEFEGAFGVAGALGVLFGARMLAGAMGGNIAAAQAYIADVTAPEERAGALGLVGAAFGLGFVFGPALGSVFASDPVVSAAESVFPAFVPATVYSLPSFAAAGASVCALLAAALFLPEPRRKRSTNAGPRGPVAAFRGALADPDLRPLVAVFLVASVAFSGVQVVFIPFVADAFGYGAAQAGLLLTYLGALGVLNQGVVVRVLSKRLPNGRIAVLGAGGLAVALAALPLAAPLGAFLPGWLSPFGGGPALFVLLVVLALLSMGNGLLNVGIAAMVSAAAGEESQGTAFGVTQGAGSLGRTVGPPVMAALYVVARPVPFELGAVLTLVTVAILLSVVRRG